MREADATTRQRLARALREAPASPSELAVRLESTPEAIVGHAEHVARSVDGDETPDRFLVAPPRCRDCGFDRFDEPLNRPSRCPECTSEAIDEPRFTIESES